MLSRELRNDLIQFIISEQPLLTPEWLEALPDRELLSIREDFINLAVIDGRL